MKHQVSGTRALAVWLCAVGPALAAGGASWVDCLPSVATATWSAQGRVEHRVVDGVLEARTGAATQWVTLPLRHELPSRVDVDIELRWEPRGRGAAGGIEVALGPHGFGSTGYRVVVSRTPWAVVECRGPALAPERWHSLRLRRSPGWLEYWLHGTRVLACPATEARGLALVLGPGTTASVRRCRRRALPGPPDAAAPAAPFFLYPAGSFGHAGRPGRDTDAPGGVTVEARGTGTTQWLLWGQDASLPRAGTYQATFGLRSVRGDGRVRLAVARTGGAIVAERTVSAAGLPTAGHARFTVPFTAQAGAAMEYRLAADDGVVLRCHSVSVTGGPRAPVGGDRMRRPPPLAEAWPRRAPRAEGHGLRILRLERRMVADGAYEVRVVWRQEGSAPLRDVAVDLWVSCRSDGGHVRVFDYGVAHNAVPRGQHVTAARLHGRHCAAYGLPSGLLVQLSHRGTPAASAWRKWGIPVEDKWILPAQRVGRLHEAAPR